LNLDERAQDYKLLSGRKSQSVKQKEKARSNNRETIWEDEREVNEERGMMDNLTCQGNNEGHKGQGRRGGTERGTFLEEEEYGSRLRLLKSLWPPENGKRGRSLKREKKGVTVNWLGGSNKRNRREVRT